MNAFPSDLIYHTQIARNQELLAEAARERHAFTARAAPTARGAAGWLRSLPVIGHRAAASHGACRTAAVD